MLIIMGKIVLDYFCTHTFFFSPTRSQEIYGAVLLALESGSNQIRCKVSVPPQHNFNGTLHS